MDFESFSALDAEITKEDWERTPESIRRLLKFLVEGVDRRLAELEEAKILSKIEEEESSETEDARHNIESEQSVVLRCSFCGQSSEEVARIVIGPTVNICNECVDICNEILMELGVKE